MFVLASQFRKNTDILAIKVPFVYEEGFFYPLEFSKFPEEAEKVGISFNPLIIEGWYVFAIKDFEKSSVINYKIKLLEKVGEIKLIDERFDEDFFIEFFKNDYLNTNIFFFKPLKSKIELKEESLKKIEAVYQFFLKLNILESTDIIPLLKLLFAQIELNLPYVHYKTERGNFSLLYLLDTFVFTVTFKKFDDYEKLAYLLTKLKGTIKLEEFQIKEE